MAIDKKTFLHNVTICHDTREQKNSHIVEQLESFGVSHREKKLDFGDYTFECGGRDFSLSCVIERKANVDELYSNLVCDRERIEKEFAAAGNIANDFILLLEGCGDETELKNFEIPPWEMLLRDRKVRNIGELCYATLKSWQCGNRYKFRTLYVKDRKETAAKILEEFYYYWRNYKIFTASRRNK